MAKKRGNGEGGTSRRKDGRWEARYYADTPDGRKRRTLYGKTRKEVAEKLPDSSQTAVHDCTYDTLIAL